MDYFSTIVIEQDANDMFNVGKFWRWLIQVVKTNKKKTWYIN